MRFLQLGKRLGLTMNTAREVEIKSQGKWCRSVDGKLLIKQQGKGEFWLN
jgi:hypothetical protein